MSQRIVLLGPPASGKGTQGRMLAEHAGLAYFSTGKQLRREVEGDTELGRRADPFLAKGHYVPDDLVVALALGWLRTAGPGWVMDGFPRTVAQAQDLDVFLRPGEDSLRALSIEVPAEELERRVRERRECRSCPWIGTRADAEKSGGCPSCGGELIQRRDDAIENFRMRLKSFGELTAPVAGYYDKTNRLLRVSGEGSPADVFARIQSAALQD